MKPYTRHYNIPYILILSAAIALSVVSSAQTDISQAYLARYQSISNMTEAQLYEKAHKFQDDGDTDSMLIYFNVLFNRYSQELSVADRRLCAIAFLESGITYYEQFNYSKAMELLLNCQRICENNCFSDILADAYRSIGNIYSSHADFERGSMFYVKSLQIADSIDNSSLRMKALNNLVGASSFEGKHAEAKKYYKRLTENPSPEALYRYDVLMDGGMIAAAENKADEAIANYMAAADYALSNRLGIKYAGAAHSHLSALYKETGQTDSALHYLHINEEAARKAKQDDLLAETLRGLSLLYKEKGDITQAQAYQAEYLDISDKVFNQREFNSLKNAEFMYELNKSNETINTLNLQKRQKDSQISAQRRILSILSIGTLVVIILLIVIYRQKRRLSTAYADLFDKNKTGLENERFYRQRIHEMEAQLEKAQEEKAVKNDTDDKSPEAQSTSSTAGIPDRLQEKLQRAIMGVMEQTDVLCDPDFTVNRLAEMVESNSTYVSRVINEMYGKNFRTVLNESRIKESMKRLGDKENFGNYTIKAIAESVGYKSQSNFIAVFTKFTGIKPSMYQEMALKRK